MGKLRFGLIGCGGIANRKHLPALAALRDEVEITSFCDVIYERAEKAAREAGSQSAKVSTDYRELVEDPQLDVIHVLTPNVNHAEITVAALEAGKHVLCEKPMSINSAGAKQMLEAAERTGKLLTIGYQNRFRKDVCDLRAIVDAGDLGEIYYAEAFAIRRKGVPTWGVFPDKAKQGGGPLIDIGTHALDLSLWMIGNYEPVAVLGQTFQKLKDYPEGNQFGPWDPETYETEDSAFGLVTLSNGATIILKAAWALNVAQSREAQVQLCGTLGGAETVGDTASNAGQVLTNTVSHGRLIDTKPGVGMGVYGFAGVQAEAPEVLEARQWVKAIKGEGEPLVKPQEALVVTQILEAIYESAATGRAVYLNEHK
ncbi:MAG: Gfo/Idh/MocA family oxidoreductase [Propionibacteriaceae bacterium]|nr:Gfo/Idh/MocA family oxidoreductase [Propionibacteriaceae bacterium]